MRATLVLFCALAFAGCSSGIAPSQLEPPASVLLVPPKALQDPKEGDDLVKLAISDRRSYATLADRHKRLQRWVKTVLGK